MWLVTRVCAKRDPARRGVTGGCGPPVEVLRPRTDIDVEAWVAMNSDPRVMEFFPGIDTRAKLEVTAERLRAAGTRRIRPVERELRESGAFAGVTARSGVPIDLPVAPAIEIGWRLVPDSGNGYATEGPHPLRELTFMQLDFNEVVAWTAAINRGRNA